MIETGAILTIQDNASATARRVAGELSEVAKSADGINSALDPRVLDQYNQKLTQIGEAYSKLNRGMQQSQSQQMQHAQQVFAGMGTTMARAGQGDVGGALAPSIASLGKFASKLGGPAGIAIAAAGAIGVGTVAASGRYEKRIPGAEMVAGLEGLMGGTIAENTQAMASAMRTTVDAVKEYGKTYEEGTVAAQAFLKAGGRDFAGTSQSAAYSLARRVDFNRLASFEGMTQRYGMKGSLGSVDALRQAQGLGIGQFEEVMGGFQDIFSAGLSRGVIKSATDIGRQQEFFSKAGVTWQGALGAQKMQGMNQAVAGAAGLQQQSDLFLYRAAAGITGGDMIETKKLMEKGLSPELYKGLMGQFGQMGYGDTEAILQLSKMFGLSTTDAESLYNLRTTGIGGTQYEGLGGPGSGKTLATQAAAAREELKQLDAEVFGEASFKVMANATIIVSGAASFLTGGTGEAFDVGGKSIEDYQAGYNQYGALKSSMGQRLDSRSPAMSAIFKAMSEAEASGISGGDIYTAIGGLFQQATSGGAQQSLVDMSESSEIVKVLKEIAAANKVTALNTGEDTILQDNSGAQGRDSNLSVGGGL